MNNITQSLFLVKFEICLRLCHCQHAAVYLEASLLWYSPRSVAVKIKPAYLAILSAITVLLSNMVRMALASNWFICLSHKISESNNGLCQSMTIYNTILHTERQQHALNIYNTWNSHTWLNISSSWMISRRNRCNDLETSRNMNLNFIYIPHCNDIHIFCLLIRHILLKCARLCIWCQEIRFTNMQITQ